MYSVYETFRERTFLKSHCCFFILQFAGLHFSEEIKVQRVPVGA